MTLMKKFASVALKMAMMVSASAFLVYYSDAEKISLFEPVGLFAYIGVLLGFAITIYTFNLSLVDGIKDEINKDADIDADKKTSFIERLINVFSEMRDGIWMLFVGIIILVTVSICDLAFIKPSNFLGKYQIPEITQMSVFFFCTYSMYDLIYTMFKISEMKLFLTERKK